MSIWVSSNSVLHNCPLIILLSTYFPSLKVKLFCNRFLLVAVIICCFEKEILSLYHYGSLGCSNRIGFKLTYLVQEAVARLEEFKKSVEAKMALRQTNLNPERPG